MQNLVEGGRQKDSIFSTFFIMQIYVAREGDSNLSPFPPYVKKTESHSTLCLVGRESNVALSLDTLTN